MEPLLHCFLLYAILFAFHTDVNGADDLPPCRKCVWELTEDEAEARFDACGNVTEADLLRFQEEDERCACTGHPDVSTATIQQMQQHSIEIKRQNPGLWPKNDGENEPSDRSHKGIKRHRLNKRRSSI